MGGDDVDGVDTKSIVNSKGVTTTVGAYYAVLTGEVFRTGYIGTDTAAGSVAIGAQATALGDIGTAIGTKATASGLASSAFGVGSKAQGENSVAIGAGSIAGVTKTELDTLPRLAAVAPATVGDLDTSKMTTLQMSQVGIKVKSATINGWKFDNFGGADTEPGDIVSFGKQGFERQLKNVAAGRIAADSTDAVNGSQLYSLTTGITQKIDSVPQHYVSIKDNGGTDVSKNGNYNNDGAKGVNAVAIGVNAQATKDDSIALGSGSVTTADKGVTGYDPRTATTSTATSSAWKSTHAAVAIGNGSTATRQITGLAAGSNDTDAVNVAQLKALETHYISVNRLTNGTATNNYNNDGAEATDSIAIGVGAKTKSDEAIAIGKEAFIDTTDNKSIAIGSKATAKVGANSDASIAIGDQATAGARSGSNREGGAIAIGQKASAGSNNSIAIGTNAKIWNQGSTAMGVGAQAYGENAIVLGNGAKSGTWKADGTPDATRADGVVALGQASWAEHLRASR